MYDVIVVGAGPAGSSAARAAAERGLEVLLVERELEIGVPDKCGEFVPSLKEMRRLIPHAKDLERYFDPPRDLIVNRTRYVRFVFPNEREISIEFEGVVIERKLFDKHLANEAARAGADVSTSVKVVDLLRGGRGIKAKTLTGLVELESKVVVAADGAYSLVARRAGLPLSSDPMDYGVGFQYEMVGVDHDPDYVDMYVGEDVAPGTYAWIIPKGLDVANVGTGVRVPYVKRGMNVRDYQRNFVEKHPVASPKLRRAKPTAVKAGCIPVGGPIEEMVAGNVLAVGDAGGHTVPTVGGGIPTGLVIGSIAGEVVASHVLEGGSLSAFDVAWRAELGETLKNSLRIRRMIDVVFKSARMIDWVTKRGWLTEEMIEKFMFCQIDVKMRLVEESIGLIGRG